MKLGVLLPSFDARAERALAAADTAEAAGIHGVFVYDHLWQPATDGRPALSPFPLLGAVAARTRRVQIGTLVARVALSPDELLVHAFCTLDVLAPGRVIAGIGTGDAMSEPENRALGLAYEPAASRRISLERCASALVAAGVETWIGGGGATTNQIAARLGIAVNLWSATPTVVAEVATAATVNWGGVLRGSVDGARLLRELADAGATWAVFTWGRRGLAPLIGAANRAGLRLDR